MSRRLVLLLTALTAVASAWGYVLHTDDSGVYVIKWQSSPVTLQVKLSTAANLSDGTSQSSSVAAAMAVWNAQLGTEQLLAQASSGSYATGNGINEIALDSTVAGQAFSSGVLAVTVSYWKGNSSTETDIVFNNTYTWDSYRGVLRRGVEDLRRVAIHELGHALGLKHPDEGGQSVVALMNSRESDLDTLAADDIVGGQKLYAAPGFVPANNNFARAVVVPFTDSPQRFDGVNLGADREANEPYHALSQKGHSVWWKWTPSSNGTVTVDTLGSDFDTVVGIYTGNSVSELVEVAYNDDEEPLYPASTPQRRRTSRVFFSTTSGTTYHIAVDGWSATDGTTPGYTGTIVLNVAWHTPPRAGPYYTVDHLAGQSAAGSSDGIGRAAQFYYPSCTAVDRSGNIFVSDSGNSTIRKITPDGVVTTFAGSVGQFGSADGTGSGARFNVPVGIVLDGDDNLYVADSGNSTIRKVTPSGYVTTLAGTPGRTGANDAFGTSANFGVPQGMAIDRTGNLYVADGLNRNIRKIAVSSEVTTVPGSTAILAFNYPYLPDQMAVESDGTILLADGVLKKLAPTGEVSKPQIYQQAFYGIARDDQGNYAVADDQSNIISLFGADLVSIASMGRRWEPGDTDGPGDQARFHDPRGLSVDRAGKIYVADYSSNAVRVCIPHQPMWTPVIFWNSPPAMHFGEALSVDQLNAMADAPGKFEYSPSSGTKLAIGDHVLKVRFTPDDTGRFVEVSAQVSVTVVAPNVTGTYFGVFPNNHGRWALKVNADNAAVYIAYLTQRNSAIIVHLTIGPDGSFTTTGTETVPLTATGGSTALSLSGSPGRGTATVASNFTLSGQIDSGAVSGQLTGLNETFTGAIDSVAGPAAGGYYSATALNTASGATYAIVAPSGQAVVVTVTSSVVDAATGIVGSNGQLSATTAGGGQLALAINGSAQSLTATLTPVGSTTPINFAGLADTVQSTSRLVNIATRAYCSTDNKVTIGGFVVSGSVAKRVLVRAVGPSLTAQGIGAAEVLADPTIEVHDAIHGNSIVATNDNWGDNTNAAEINHVVSSVGASALLGSDTKSATALLNLAPGVYSFVVNGKAGTSGVVLLEVYDADATTTGTTFANIATRADATTGNGVTIGGFVITGNAPKHVLLRAVGPTLTKQGLGVAEVLADPTIELHDAIHGNAIIATNDNWGEVSAEKAAITSAGARIGAMPFDQADTKSAALLVTLQPGVYSFIAQGLGGAPSGIVLVEVYDAD